MLRELSEHQPYASAGQEACADGLVGRRLGSILFATDAGDLIDLGEIALHGLVLYLQPGLPLLAEDDRSLREDQLQRDSYTALLSQFDHVMPGGSIISLSTAPDRASLWNNAARARCLSTQEPNVGHCVIADPHLMLAKEVGAPTTQHQQLTRYERTTIVAVAGRIAKVFHPAAAGRDASQALAWLQLH